MKIGSIDETIIIKEVGKYMRWLENFITLYSFSDGKVLKWYFLSKKVRVCLWFREYKWQMIPFFIARKESKDGYNITKDDEEKLNREILRHIDDIESGCFKIVEL